MDGLVHGFGLEFVQVLTAVGVGLLQLLEGLLLLL